MDDDDEAVGGGGSMSPGPPPIVSALMAEGGGKIGGEGSGTLSREPLGPGWLSDPLDFCGCSPAQCVEKARNWDGRLSGCSCHHVARSALSAGAASITGNTLFCTGGAAVSFRSRPGIHGTTYPLANVFVQSRCHTRQSQQKRQRRLALLNPLLCNLCQACYRSSGPNEHELSAICTCPA